MGTPTPIADQLPQRLSCSYERYCADTTSDGQSVVFSIVGVSGGTVALVAGLRILGSYSPVEDDSWSSK